jgi:hypothetical protein
MGKTLFILGAGFTKAFIDEAFLSVDQGHVPEELIHKYPKTTHPYAHSILDDEIDRGVDIERLMTRLHSFMPHDFERKCTQELEHLSHDIKDLFIKRLQKLKDDKTQLPGKLMHFAQWCIDNEADCISFNYDDFLDHALWKCKPLDSKHASMYQTKHWHPDSGYGFFCRPANSCIRDQGLIMGSSAMLLLKLHGSINWRIKLGASDPYQLDSILHYEKWIPQFGRENYAMYDDPAKVENHLKPERLLVLPVLHKTDIVRQPIFRRIWAESFDRLNKADGIVFIGYSMPRTDIATGFLLREALRDKEEITVVNYVDPSAPESERDHNALVSAYRSVIPRLKGDNFKFEGAISWITANLQNPCG